MRYHSSIEKGCYVPPVIHMQVALSAPSEAPITNFISPYKNTADFAQRLIDNQPLLDFWLHSPIETAEYEEFTLTVLRNLTRAGSVSLTLSQSATDPASVDYLLEGGMIALSVKAGAVVSADFTVPVSFQAGSPVSVDVTGRDWYGNVVDDVTLIRVLTTTTTLSSGGAAVGVCQSWFAITSSVFRCTFTGHPTSSGNYTVELSSSGLDGTWSGPAYSRVYSIVAKSIVDETESAKLLSWNPMNTLLAGLLSDHYCNPCIRKCRQVYCVERKRCIHWHLCATVAQYLGHVLRSVWI